MSILVRVLYPFEYETGTGQKVWMQQGEKLLLLCKTNQDWWQVIRQGERRPFYAPASYIEVENDTCDKPVARRQLSDDSVVRLATNKIYDCVPIVKESKQGLSEGEWAKKRLSAQSSVIAELESVGLCRGEVRLSTRKKNELKDKNPPTPSPRLISLGSKTDLDKPPTSNRSGDYSLVKRTQTKNVVSDACEHTLSTSLEDMANQIHMQTAFVTVETSTASAHYVAISPVVNDAGSENTDSDDSSVGFDSVRERLPTFSTFKSSADTSPATPVQSVQEQTNSENVFLTEDNIPITVPLPQTSSHTSNNLFGSSPPPNSISPPPLYSNFPLKSRPLPVPPSPDAKPIRQLDGGWEEFVDDETGRAYYCERLSGQCTWKPPRRKSDKPSYPLSVESCTIEESVSTPDYCLPDGWTVTVDELSNQQCYIREDNGEKWFSCVDSEGHIYFFEENSNESSWTLPEVTIQSSSGTQSTISDTPPPLTKSRTSDSLATTISLSDEHVITRGLLGEQRNGRTIKSKSLMLDPRQTVDSIANKPRNFTIDGRLVIPCKYGDLHRTRLTENGKKVRKNWSPAFAVLTDNDLLLFREKNVLTRESLPKPEIQMMLRGAMVTWSTDKSSRKNVFQLSDPNHTQVLLQTEDATKAHEWFQAIEARTGKAQIDRLLRRHGSESPPKRLLSPEEGRKAHNRLSRNKSVRAVVSNSAEDVSGSPSESRMKIKAKLKKFFYKRPTKESLMEKGIYKDEPVFGCNLDKLCYVERGTIPLFVKHCIHVIESKEENLKSDGLYRASGNLSQVQRVRLQVDQNHLSVLEEEDDVHVLTGALKLFFRELKEPLIPYKVFQKAINAANMRTPEEQLVKLREVVKLLPKTNHDTLRFLLSHIRKVTEYEAYNRMDFFNMAIVFGPTLMWPETESIDLALDVMQQNRLIERILFHYSKIFPP